jgi:nitrogen fixation protein NifU and related proteins
MANLYREIIIDHYKNPRNTGTIKSPSKTLGSVNYSCGDETTITLIIDNGKIIDIKHDTRGCAISIAATSLLCQQIRGKTLKYIKSIKNKDVIDLLGGEISPSRMKCALLPLDAIKKLNEKVVK